MEELVAAGAMRADSPAKVAQQTKRIFTMLPDSPDVDILAGAVVRRVRQHVERDGRLLLRAGRLTLS